MDKIRVSVILPQYNAERFVTKAIESVLAQTMTELELIIVDDNSTDQSLRLAQSFSDSRIRIFHNCKNLGVSACRNKGIEEAQSDTIAMIDADDVYEKTKLEEQLKLFGPRRVVYTGFYRLSEDGRRLLDDTKLHQEPFAKYLATGASIHFPTMMFSKRQARAFGMYDESLRTGGDFDFAWKLCERGITFVGIPKPLYGYRTVAGSLTRKYDRMHHKRRYDLIMRHKQITQIYDPQVLMNLARLIVSSRNYAEAMRWIIKDPVTAKRFFDIILSFLTMPTAPKRIAHCDYV